MINFSLACYPGYSPEKGMQLAYNAADPVLGRLALNDVQICPQNCIQKLDESVIDRLKQDHPETRFRLHANVKVLDKHNALADLSGLSRYPDYFKRLADLSKYLGANAYTLHAGRRIGSWRQLIANRQKVEDLFGVPVGIEGMYPTNKINHYWLNSWEEYQWLLRDKIDYALDLSHLNIVRHFSGRLESELVKELLSSEHCIELHLSGNDGEHDGHKPVDASEWWHDYLKHINPNATVFYEGNLKKY